MQKAIDKFEHNIEYVMTLRSVYLYLKQNSSPAIDSALDEILRAKWVMGVSCLDTYIHDLVHIGAIEIYYGKRVKPKNFDSIMRIFSTELNQIGKSVNQLSDLPKLIIEFQNLTTNASQQQWLEHKINKLYGQSSFQSPKKIENAIKIISDIDNIWKEIAKILNKYPDAISEQLDLIIDRRNKIVHESDNNPVDWIQYRQITRNPISLIDADNALIFIKSFAMALYKILN